MTDGFDDVRQYEKLDETPTSGGYEYTLPCAACDKSVRLHVCFADLIHIACGSVPGSASSSAVGWSFNAQQGMIGPNVVCYCTATIPVYFTPDEGSRLLQRAIVEGRIPASVIEQSPLLKRMQAGALMPAIPEPEPEPDPPSITAAWFEGDELVVRIPAGRLKALGVATAVAGVAHEGEWLDDLSELEPPPQWTEWTDETIVNLVMERVMERVMETVWIGEYAPFDEALEAAVEAAWDEGADIEIRDGAKLVRDGVYARPRRYDDIARGAALIRRAESRE